MNESLSEVRKTQKRRNTLTRIGKVLLTGVNGGLLSAFLYTLPSTGVIVLDPFWRYGLPLLIMIFVGILNQSIPDAVVAAMIAFTSHNLIMFYFLLMPAFLGVYVGDIAVFTLANAASVVQSAMFILTISIFGAFIGALLYEFV
ncbi:MAG: hypothetical protein ACW976_02680 [Candidatus Ranarchaeia archaeon]|jgi:hypothetical protein